MVDCYFSHGSNSNHDRRRLGTFAQKNLAKLRPVWFSAKQFLGNLLNSLKEILQSCLLRCTFWNGSCNIFIKYLLCVRQLILISFQIIVFFSESVVTVLWVFCVFVCLFCAITLQIILRAMIIISFMTRQSLWKTHILQLLSSVVLDLTHLLRIYQATLYEKV